MPTLETVIKKIRESIDEIEKKLLSIVIDAQPPVVSACTDEQTAKKMSDERPIPAILTPGSAPIKFYPRFVCVPRDLAMDIISLVTILQKNVESAETPITHISFEGVRIPITTMRPYKKLAVSIKDLETLTLCNIETVHGSKFPDPKINPDDVL